MEIEDKAVPSHMVFLPNVLLQRMQRSSRHRLLLFATLDVVGGHFYHFTNITQNC